MSRLTALFLSGIFHPLLLPGYLYYAVCFHLPGLVRHPQLPARWQLLGLVVLFTLVLPTLGTALLLWTNVLQGTLELRERPQRPLPLLLATVSFGAATVLLASAPEPVDSLLRYLMTGMTLLVLLVLLISLRWKISAHGAGVGGAVGLFVVLYFSEPTPGALGWWLLGSLAVAGGVLKARLVLRAHTPAQAWAGFVLGVALVVGFGLSIAALPALQARGHIGFSFSTTI